MAQSHEDVVSLVETIVLSLVDDAEAVSLDDYVESDGLHIDITVAQDEVGKVIGRQGRVIKAIRLMARAAASQYGSNVEVEVMG